LSVHQAQSPPKPATARPLPRRRAIAERLLDGPGFNRLRFVVDTVMLLLAVVAAVAGAHAAHVHIPSPAILAVFPPLTLALLALRGMYRTRMRILILDGIAPVVGAISIAAMSTIVLQVLFDPGSHPAGLIARAWVFAIVYVGGGRILLAMSQRRARARGALAKPTLIVGSGVVGSHVARRLEEVPDYGLRPIGFLDDDPLASVDLIDRHTNVLGTTRHLAEVAQRTGAQHVILAFTNSPDSGLVPLVRRCEELGLGISVCTRSTRRAGSSRSST
jgi:FlaA1/EpsC-like NDP-sugar epimerase